MSRAQTGFELAYVAVACTDPPAVADIFERVLGLARVDVAVAGEGAAPVFPIGATALALFAPHDPFLDGDAKPGLRHVTLATDAPAACAKALGLPVAGGDGLGLAGHPEVRLAPSATAGVRTRFGPALDGLPAATGDVVERIDHIGVASADNLAAQRVFAERLSCAVESTQTDMEISMALESFTSDRYGVVYHSRPPQTVGGLRVSFISVGDCELEFLQPFDPTPRCGDLGEPLGRGPGNTRGDRGAIGRFIDRRGPGLHHLALKTPDIDAALGRLAAAGHRVIDASGRPGSRRARIGFVHPSTLGGLLVHFVERAPV